MDVGRYFDLTVSEGIATLSFRNPPANSLTKEALADFGTVLTGGALDGARALLVTGEKRVFSTGFTREDISRLTSASEESALGHRLLNQVEAFAKPVIACINGLCLGGGLDLALACHIRFCSERARLGLPEVSLGLIPGLGGTQRLPRVVGVANALELILGGHTIKAAEAKRRGLVDRVCPADVLLAESRRFARRITKAHPKVVAAALKCVLRSRTLGLEQGLRAEAKAFGELAELAREESSR